MNHKKFLVPPGKRIRLRDYDPAFTGPYRDREQAAGKLAQDVKGLAKYQNLLYAQNTHSVLVVLQAMDTAGKDGAIRHVMKGVSPLGTQVHSFKAPSAEELDHDYLWRSMRALPERGNIGIFNRSYYEEVLVVRVHPELLEAQNLPPEAKGEGIWKRRCEEINAFEKYLTGNGIVVLKFFLHLSKEEQKRRLLARIDTPEKNWKFSLADVEERAHWDGYMKAYEDAINRTSTGHAPWHIVPADNKWFTRAVIADVILAKLKSLDLRYPVAGKAHRRKLEEAKAVLEKEVS
jgi:PPK2 family polyphosphate:nucleotide phosphotransferase